MQIDLFGKKRYKVNLHMHTTLSDGRKSPAEAVQIYRQNGYDAVAMTDHWFWGDGEGSEDFTVLAGAEPVEEMDDLKNSLDELQRRREYERVKLMADKLAKLAGRGEG
ncbi:MAG: hypothetical protein IJX62_05290, partial [Clostridia bacterium]|nr:hypothetical protein [Clostridia bacterium]